jgi:2-dehydropantoate 2-reductase
VRLRHDDVLVLTTKTQQAVTALEQWVGQDVFDDSGARIGIAGDCLPIFTATNGVESERMALRLFARVYAVCVWLPSAQLVPGEVILRIGPSSGTFIVGRYASAPDARDRALLERVAADWTASTFSVRLVDDVMRWKYEKLLTNLANALQALVGADADFGPIADRLWAEGETVFKLAGIDSATEAEELEWRGNDFEIHAVEGEPAELGGSSWQSLARGSTSIESDYLNGEIVLIAREHGGTAPLNQVVQGLVRAAVAAGAGVGSMTLEQLEAALEH